MLAIHSRLLGSPGAPCKGAGRGACGRLAMSSAFSGEEGRGCRPASPQTQDTLQRGLCEWRPLSLCSPEVWVA